MREERNTLLKESDYTVLPDFLTSNKQTWYVYRQQLRDFSSVWNVGVPFPSKSIFKWYYIRVHCRGGTIIIDIFYNSFF
jgi:hypothetical protein